MPHCSFGQQKAVQYSSDSLNEIYAVIDAVIASEKLEKKYGLKIIPAFDVRITEVDSIYLPTMLIKPEPDDTANKPLSTFPWVVSSINYTDRNVFTQADLNYIDSRKRVFIDFKWDIDRLGFNTNNKSRYFVFSIPRFNIEHNKAIVSYQFRCAGLCGGGQTLFLNKTQKGWTVSTLDIWFH